MASGQVGSPKMLIWDWGVCYLCIYLSVNDKSISCQLCTQEGVDLRSMSRLRQKLRLRDGAGSGVAGSSANAGSETNQDVAGEVDKEEQIRLDEMFAAAEHAKLELECECTASK